MLIRQTSPSLPSSQIQSTFSNWKFNIGAVRELQVSRTYLERIWAINILSSVSALKVAL